jgi:hypothetical protein
MSMDIIARGLALTASKGLPTLYLGQVATRCRFASTALASGSAVWSSGRTMHWATDRIVSPQVVWPMWSLSNSNVETLKAGGTVRAAIELTLGTRAAQNVEGDVSFVNGFAVTSFPGLVIPKGARFWVDHLVQNANGVVFSNIVYSQADITEGWTFGTGAVTDYTASGTPPVSFGQSQGYWPIMILAPTRQASVLVFGTSKRSGVADYQSDATADVGQLARIIGRRFGYTTLALPSSLLAQFNAASKTYRDQITGGTISGANTGVPYHSHMTAYDLVNDFQSGGDTAAAAVARRVTMAAAYPNHIMIGTTDTPNPSSTDNFITLANQTATGTTNAKIQAANSLIRAGLAGEKVLWDISDLIDPFRTGKWPVSRNPNDTTFATASFTGSVPNNTAVLTASSVTGTITLGAQVLGTGVSGTAQIAEQLTGTIGGAGTYRLNFLQSPALTSVAMTTASFITGDGLHENGVALQLIADRGQPLLSLIQR